MIFFGHLKIVISIIFLFALSLTACSSKSDLASQLEDDWAFKRNFDGYAIDALMIDSAYGVHQRLNPYKQGEKRVYYYFETINITFEVSGEGGEFPVDRILGVRDGK